MSRRHLAIPLALLAIALLATPALGGGWAEVVPDERTISGVEPGVPHDVGITLLQHGVTPVRDGIVRLTLTNDATGTTITADAQHVGDGQWRASVTLPETGSWALVAAHSDLDLTRAAAITVSVALGGQGAAMPGVVTPGGPLIALLAGLGVMVVGAVALVRLARPRSGQGAVPS